MAAKPKPFSYENMPITEGDIIVCLKELAYNKLAQIRWMGHLLNTANDLHGGKETVKRVMTQSNIGNVNRNAVAAMAIARMFSVTNILNFADRGADITAIGSVAQNKAIQNMSQTAQFAWANWIVGRKQKDYRPFLKTLNDRRTPEGVPTIFTPEGVVEAWRLEREQAERLNAIELEAFNAFVESAPEYKELTKVVEEKVPYPG